MMFTGGAMEAKGLGGALRPQAAASGGASSVLAQPEMGRLIERLEEVIGITASLGGITGAIADRVFGPPPAEPEGGDGMIPFPGQLGTAHSRIDTIISELERAHKNVARLAQL